LGCGISKLAIFKVAIASSEKAPQFKPDCLPAIENRDRLLQILGQ
jgi:hypothetical protein